MIFSPDWVRLGGFTQRGIVQMGINLGGVEVAVTQNLLQGTGIHAVFQHQGGCRMASFVWGIPTCVQTGHFHGFFQHLLDPARTESAVFLTDE